MRRLPHGAACTFVRPAHTESVCPLSATGAGRLSRREILYVPTASEHLWKLGIETLPVCESGTYRTALEAHAAAYLAAISYVDVLTTFPTA